MCDSDVCFIFFPLTRLKNVTLSPQEGHISLASDTGLSESTAQWLMMDASPQVRNVYYRMDTFSSDERKKEKEMLPLEKKELWKLSRTKAENVKTTRPEGLRWIWNGTRLQTAQFVMEQL